MSTRPTISLSADAEAKLRIIMDVRRLDSLEAAAEFAFKESEWKALQIRKLYADPEFGKTWADAFYPENDLENPQPVKSPDASRADAH